MAGHSTILVIDDERQVRESFRFFLEDCDYRVIEARDGVEGLERYREVNPDVILLDLRMARKDGLDVLAELGRVGNETPVIVISGTGVFEDVVNALKLGAWDFLMKPVKDLNVLKHAVERARQHSLLRAENRRYQEHLEELVEERTVALQQSEKKYRDIFEQLQDVYFETTPDGELLVLSPAAADMFKVPRETLLASSFWALFASSATAVTLRRELETQGRIDDFEALLHATTAGRAWFYGSLSACLRLAEDGSPERICGMIRNVSERKKALDEVEYLAFFDTLTGLPNRRKVLQLLQHAIDEAQAEGVQGGILYIDVDRFKTVNDSLGHATGDALITELGRRLARAVMPPAKLGRVGADEFTLILPRLATEASAAEARLQEVVDVVRDDFTQPITVDGHELYLTVTIGTALFPDAVASAEELLRHADIAMHAAKSVGCNRVLHFQPEMLSRVRSHLSVEKELRAGLGRGEFIQYFHPQVDRDGHVVGAEALARWLHPVRGVLAPAEFIAVAETTGLIEAIGEELLEYACRELVEWERSGLPATFRRLAINVSARQFHSPRFVATFEAVLRRTGANPQRLTLELTENILLENIPEVTATLERLRDLGVTISIDDFGTGYSSLAYLQRLPLGELKIDRSFVQGLHSGGGAAEIVSTIIVMAHAMGMEVVAEGVETQFDLDELLRRDCTTFQGFHFYRPLAAASFTELLFGPAVCRRPVCSQ